MTKLCDLGPYDGVCSVQWTKEGSFISIGTNLGQVQVPLAISLIRFCFKSIHVFENNRFGLW